MALLESFGQSASRKTSSTSSARVFASLKQTAKKRTRRQFEEDHKDDVVSDAAKAMLVQDFSAKRARHDNQ